MAALEQRQRVRVRDRSQGRNREASIGALLAGFSADLRVSRRRKRRSGGCGNRPRDHTPGELERSSAISVFGSAPPATSRAGRMTGKRKWREKLT
jgi:hypothetical protein